jgi:hypothetical protein
MVDPQFSSRFHAKTYLSHRLPDFAWSQRLTITQQVEQLFLFRPEHQFRFAAVGRQFLGPRPDMFECNAQPG